MKLIMYQLHLGVQPYAVSNGYEMARKNRKYSVRELHNLLELMLGVKGGRDCV